MITELLNIKYPIIQGGMAHIADAKLASSVSNSGALGIIASGGLTGLELKEEIDKCKSLTNKPFGVNLMMMAPNLDELVDVVIKSLVKIVTTGAGSPKKYMELFKSNNIKVIPVIPTVAIAKKMESLGVDAVIAEGMEAGGHIGSTTTLCLVEQVSREVNIPVIAAGGIASGRAMASMFCLGAKGVQIGTRFLLSDECKIDDKYKAKLIEAIDTSTVVTGLSVSTPIRSIKNDLTNKYMLLEQCNNKEELEKLTLGSLKKAVEGDIDNGSLMAGQIVGLIKEIKSVKEIIDDIILEYNEIIIPIISRENEMS